MVAAGVTGVHFYKKKLQQALRCSRRAYILVQDTNPHDRHLFKLAFSIAAQFESLKSSMLALRYYRDALELNPLEPNVAKKD
ncbi:Tetratricopeptide-like helical [Plasmopara halstedii]|uniref:Tetratricopeptide-like helical n=1 Tax=Plasmopara halstedii TaxID=4781 RepID=A0A0P1B3U1_PLAHL|nr:Tetratricopeptide-like helical [Plasmopara halstedii]CEG49429.1 Tetratricopeptide-like helical [Plasmopara halstedii]|eukprot:XP_024585798.1 Tetratricopeptide-like helical [Plasmopara halstedii]